MSQIMLVGTNFSSKHAVDMIWNSFFCFYEWYLELIPTQTNQKIQKSQILITSKITFKLIGYVLASILCLNI